MKSLGRNERREDKPRSIVFDGSNGAKVAEWARDKDLLARFQHRPELPEEPARVQLAHPHIHWEVVPAGSTISLDEDDNLVLTLPESDEESA